MKLFILSCVWAALLPAQTAQSFGSIAGSVRDAGTGEPVRVFDILLCDDPTGGGQRNVTTPEGYAFYNVAPGTYRLSYRLNTGNEINKNVTVIAGERTVVDFIQPSDSHGSIAGLVLDVKGKPVAKARV